jgi:hypothetical protein
VDLLLKPGNLFEQVAKFPLDVIGNDLEVCRGFQSAMRAVGQLANFPTKLGCT